MLNKFIPNRVRSPRDKHQTLKRTVLERRQSLTPTEFEFLENVCQQGSEHDADIANRSLLELDVLGDDTYPVGVSSPSGSSVGSTRRQSLLTERKKESCMLWEAHDSGLALTPRSSQHSLLIRKIMGSLSPRGRRTERRQSSAGRGELILPCQRTMMQRSRSVYSDSSDEESRGLSIVEQRSRRFSSSRLSSGKMFDLAEEEDTASRTSATEESSKPMGLEVSSSSLLPAEEVTDSPPKPNKIMMREASVNNYKGEGFELGLLRVSQDSMAPDERREGDETQRFLQSQDDERDETLDEGRTHVDSPGRKLQRPVLMKLASMSLQAPGEGMEVADWNNEWRAHHHQNIGNNKVLRRSSSFDQSMSFDRVNNRFTKRIRRSLSDGALSDHEEADEYFLSKIGEYDHYDPWDLLDEMRISGTLPFKILGTNAHDVECHPHVLSPPLMERLQQYLPFNKRGENMWLKYSLVREGASMHSFLKHAKGSSHTFLAIETVDGEVFGSFTVAAWRRSQDAYGNGQSFLWRTKHSRHEKTWSVIDQAQRESEIDVFPFMGVASRVQMCNDKRLVVGGVGEPNTHARTLFDGTFVEKHEWGFGISINGDILLEGTSSPCVSFSSPSLSRVHSDGSVFEIVNLELWTLTPCMNESDAQHMEMKHLFLDHNTRRL